MRSTTRPGLWTAAQVLDLERRVETLERLVFVEALLLFIVIATVLA